MNHPTSKRPNPSKFHHNNRCLIPFRTEKVSIANKTVKRIVPVRKPGQIIKSNDGKFTYRMELNGALVKIPNT